MAVQRKNYLLFKTAKTSVEKEGAIFTVSGIKFPFCRGRYKILVEEPGYGFTERPKEMPQLIRAVRESLNDNRAPAKSV